MRARASTSCITICSSISCYEGDCAPIAFVLSASLDQRTPQAVEQLADRRRHAERIEIGWRDPCGVRIVERRQCAGAAIEFRNARLDIELEMGEYVRKRRKRRYRAIAAECARSL